MLTNNSILPASAPGAALSADAARGKRAETGPVARDLKRLRDTTGQIVGSVFYGTMLRAMRESTLKGKFGHGGRGEEVFGAQLDQILAERAGEASGSGVGEALYERLAHQQKVITQNAMDLAA